MSNDTRRIDSLASAAFVAEGADLVNAPSSSLLYDKIINVKFIRAHADKNGKQFFCIRSDYEPVYHHDGTVEFVPCTQKPSITVSAMQVSDSTAVNVKIKIKSLFIDREMAGEEIDSVSGNPVMWAVVQLGYRDEFPRWDKATALDSADRFFDLDNNTLTNGKGSLIGKQLLVQILNAYPESMPPERSWVFNGVVATLECGLRWDHSADDLVPGFGNKNFPVGKSPLEAALFQWITRRFIRAGIEHIVAHDTKESGGIEVDVITISVKGESGFEPLTLDSDGLLTPSDAQKYGVLCTCTEALRKIGSGDAPLVGTFSPGTSKEDTKDSVGGVNAGFIQFDNPMRGLAQQLNAIKKQLEYLRWYTSCDGNLFFYKDSENADDLCADPAIKERQRNGVLKLPAVYDITVSGMRVIRCPFRRVIDPMTTVLFQSRYRIVDQTGYYYQPKRGYDAFLVILSSFTFSTVDDDNVMELSCVDIPEDQAPDVDFDTGIVIPRGGTTPTAQEYSTDPQGAIDKAKYAWASVSIKVGTYPFDRVDFGWLELARGILECAKPDDWPSGLPDLTRALTDLKSWNAEGVWNAGREKVDDDYSPENDLTPGLGFKIPWLYPGDTVVIRQPYKESYDMSWQQKEVKANG